MQVRIVGKSVEVDLTKLSPNVQDEALRRGIKALLICGYSRLPTSHTERNRQTLIKTNLKTMYEGRIPRAYP